MVDTGPKHIWLHEILSDLGAALGHPDSDLINLFEAQVRERLLLGAVRLREIPSHQHARLVAPTRSASAVVLAVPTTDVRALGVLEASARHGRLLDDHDCECLFVAANLGGFVLQASRTKSTPPVRHAQAPTLVGPGPAMRALRAQIERVASTDFTILIEGESGTGKELVARQIHDLSRRRLGPFVAVNCAAVVETLLEAELFGIEDRTATGVRGRRGKFESADGGTLFLDEVADLSPAAQAKLLRAVQEMAVERVGGVGSRRVNTRIVVATNKPLADLVAEGSFRQDLYYRFSGVEIRVPPLRARQEDIPVLVEHFLRRHDAGRPLTVSAPAADALRLYAWPGNVRELQRLVERTVAMTASDRIELDDLPAHVRGQYAEVLIPSLIASESMRSWGSRYARLVFERCGRNKRRACKRLDISYHTLQAYLRYRDATPTPRTAQFPRWVGARLLESPPARHPIVTSPPEVPSASEVTETDIAPPPTRDSASAIASADPVADQGSAVDEAAANS
jgi:DNA-binding NtrC family response regulator